MSEHRLLYIFMFMFDAIPPCLLQVILRAFHMRTTIDITLYSSVKVHLFLSDVVSQFQFTSVELSSAWCYFLTDLSGFCWCAYCLYFEVKKVFMITDDQIALLVAWYMQGQYSTMTSIFSLIITTVNIKFLPCRSVKAGLLGVVDVFQGKWYSASMLKCLWHKDQWTDFARGDKV